MNSFALSYNTTLQNKINFKASEVRDPDFWDKMQTGMTHKFSIGLPTFTILKYIYSGSVGLIRYELVYSVPRISTTILRPTKWETTRTGLFEDFGISQDFSASAALSTRLYGMFNFRRGKLKAIRHMVSPSISVNYAPEMGTAMNGIQSLQLYRYTRRAAYARVQQVVRRSVQSSFAGRDGLNQFPAWQQRGSQGRGQKGHHRNRTQEDKADRQPEPFRKL